MQRGLFYRINNYNQFGFVNVRLILHIKNKVLPHVFFFFFKRIFLQACFKSSLVDAVPVLETLFGHFSYASKVLRYGAEGCSSRDHESWTRASPLCLDPGHCWGIHACKQSPVLDHGVLFSSFVRAFQSVVQFVNASLYCVQGLLSPQVLLSVCVHRRFCSGCPRTVSRHSVRSLSCFWPLQTAWPAGSPRYWTCHMVTCVLAYWSRWCPDGSSTHTPCLCRCNMCTSWSAGEEVREGHSLDKEFWGVACPASALPLLCCLSYLCWSRIHSPETRSPQ